MTGGKEEIGKVGGRKGERPRERKRKKEGKMESWSKGGREKEGGRGEGQSTMHMGLNSMS